MTIIIKERFTGISCDSARLKPSAITESFNFCSENNVPDKLVGRFLNFYDEQFSFKKYRKNTKVNINPKTEVP